MILLEFIVGKTGVKNIKSAINALGNVQDMLDDIALEMEQSKDLFTLCELSEYVERFCSDNNTMKSDICLLANISSTTLTSALKNPEKASMNTIISIGRVVGFELFIGRKVIGRKDA